MERVYSPSLDSLAAADFFTVEVWTPFGLVRHVVFLVLEFSTRRVDIAGIAPDPNGSWMVQVARNLTDCFDGFLLGKHYLIHDRDLLYTARFAETLAAAGVRCVKLSPKTPNVNAYAERFVRSIKSECLNRMIFFGGNHLRCAVNEYVAHYHAERNHQGIGNRLIGRKRRARPQKPRPRRLTHARRRIAEVLSSGRRVTESAILFAHRPRTSNRAALMTAALR